MNVLVDTPVWSAAFRRYEEPLLPEIDILRRELRRLTLQQRTRLIGPIRQEILSGIRESLQFIRLRNEMRAFADELLSREDYERAAEASNHLRSRGIAHSPVDLLICTVAERRQWAIFTTDRDFGRYASALAVTLHRPPSI